MIMDKIKRLFVKEKPVQVVRKPALKRPVKKNSRKLPSLIYLKDGRFVVQKKINGVNYYFGSFGTVDEAIKRKQKLEAVGWDKNKL